MKAIVTGASGYIGFHLVSELLKEGYTVYAVCKNSPGYLENIEDKSNLILLDAAVSEIENRMKSEVPDIFYHLAWQGTLGDQRADAGVQIENEILSVEAMYAAKRIGCKKIIFTGTVYERMTDEMLASEKFYGNSFYCISKKHTQDMVRQMAKQMNMKTVWVQFCHPVGKYMNEKQLFPYAVQAFCRNEPTQFGSCENFFDIITVKYLVKGLRLLGENDVPGYLYYIGSGKPRILREYLEETAKRLNYQLPVGFGIRPDDGLDLQENWFDTTTFERDTGMRCEDSIENLIESIVEK